MKKARNNANTFICRPPPTRGSIIQDPKTSLQLFVGLFRCAYFLVYQIYSHENEHLDNLGLFEFL